MKNFLSRFVLVSFVTVLCTIPVQAQQRQLNGARPIEQSVWEEALKGRTPSSSHPILSIMRKVTETRYVGPLSFTWASAPGADPLSGALIESAALDASGNVVGKAGYGRIEILSGDYRMMMVPLKEIAPDAKSVRVRILPKEGKDILELTLPLKWGN